MNKPFLLHWMVRNNFRAKQKAYQKLCIGHYSHPLLWLLFWSTVGQKNRETSVRGNYEKCMNMWISDFTWWVGGQETVSSRPKVIVC